MIQGQQVLEISKGKLKIDSRTTKTRCRWLVKAETPKSYEKFGNITFKATVHRQDAPLFFFVWFICNLIGCPIGCTYV